MGNLNKDLIDKKQFFIYFRKNIYQNKSKK